MQCEALAREGIEVTLYGKRTMPDEAMLLTALHDAYGIELPRGRVVTYFSKSERANSLKIAALALFTMHKGSWPTAILSRNLYASYAVAVLQRRPLMFETHQLELGIRRNIQRTIMTRPWVTTIVISRKLLECLTHYHGVPPARPLVLHDAAPQGIVPLPVNARRRALSRIVSEPTKSWQAVCGYFGHLYPGRGIEIIEAMAAARPNILFLVFGGNETDIEARRRHCNLTNLHYAGHLPHRVAQEAMRSVDVLLMPYQANVSIGVSGQDTARWMSPMKMFEYLASGVPMISSDLPVLREVLRDGENCLLVSPSRCDSWLDALDRLTADCELASAIGKQGHADYLREHTWANRAKRIIQAAAVDA